jgi:hypothetical protein
MLVGIEISPARDDSHCEFVHCANEIKSLQIECRELQVHFFLRTATHTYMGTGSCRARWTLLAVLNQSNGFTLGRGK